MDSTDLSKQDLEDFLDELKFQITNFPSYINHNMMSTETQRRIELLERKFDAFDEKLTRGNDLDIAIQKDMESLMKAIESLAKTLEKNYLDKNEFELQKRELQGSIDSNRQRLEKLNDIDEKLKNLEVLSFLIKHPKLTGFVFLGMYLFAIQDVRTGIIDAVQGLLF